jgi:hypothetical protein
MRGYPSTLWAAATILCVLSLGGGVWASYIEEEPPGPPPTRPPDIVRPIPPTPIVRLPQHVPELSQFLEAAEIQRPLVCGRLAVFPVTLRGGGSLRGSWLTMDAALSRGSLIVTEKGGGSVPVIWMENRSRDASVLILAGEVVSGGKQTRTVREDVVLAPGQAVDIGVFCVEAHRWQGGTDFKASEAMVPPSIQKEMRTGADQTKVWSEVARSNAAAGGENPTGSYEQSLKAPTVQRQLEEVRRTILPEVRKESVGFIFVDRMQSRGLGVEFFGSTYLAQTYLRKLIDAYAVDFVVNQRDGGGRGGSVDEGVARDFLSRIRQAGSWRVGTPGSGAGIQMQGQGLVGTGVSLGGDLVHFGCQSAGDVVVPQPIQPYVSNPRGE